MNGNLMAMVAAIAMGYLAGGWWWAGWVAAMWLAMMASMAGNFWAGWVIQFAGWWIAAQERQRKEKEEAQRRAVDRQRQEDAR